MPIKNTKIQLWKVFGLILFFCLPTPINAQVSPAAPESIDKKKTKVSTANGHSVVVTANPLASDAALATLKKGGTAMDAVVAAQVVRIFPTP